jgi:hypothetical protein
MRPLTSLSLSTARVLRVSQPRGIVAVLYCTVFYVGAFIRIVHVAVLHFIAFYVEVVLRNAKGDVS